MAFRLLASARRGAVVRCHVCASRRTATTYSVRLGYMLQGTRTPKSALMSRRTRRPGLLPEDRPNPQYLQTLRPAPGQWTKKRRAGRSHASRMNRRGVHGQNHKTSRTYVGGGSNTLSSMIPRRIIIPKEPGLELAELHVDHLAYYVRQGRIDPSKPVTLKELTESGCCRPKEGGIRLYGTPSPSYTYPDRVFPALNIVVTKASPNAIRTVEAAGGTIVARYHNKLGAMAASRPDRFTYKGRDVPRLADPVSKRDLEYYSDPANRGYIWLQNLEHAPPQPAVRRARPPKNVGRAAASRRRLAPVAPGPAGLENPPERRAEEA